MRDSAFRGDVLTRGCDARGPGRWWSVPRRGWSAAAVGVAAMGLSLGGVNMAHAQSCAPGSPAYPPTQCQALVNSTLVVAGGNVTISGAGFGPNTSVSIELLSSPVHLATVTAGSGGDVTETVTIPATTSPGTHTLTLTGVDPSGSPRQLTVSITVKSELAATGTSDLAQIEVAGGALLGAGVLALLLARRRRRSDDS